MKTLFKVAKMDITDVHVPWSVVIAKRELLATKRQASVTQVVKNIGVNQNVKVTFLDLINDNIS